MDLETLRQLLEEFIPFNKFLGTKCVELRRSFVRIELPFREEFIGDPLRRALHGGVISTLADLGGGIAVWSEITDPRGRVSTIDLRVDYLRPGRPETLAVEASVVRRGNRVGVADMRLFHPSSPDETVATGKGVYNIVLKDPGDYSGTRQMEARAFAQLVLQLRPTGATLDEVAVIVGGDSSAQGP